MAPRNEVSGKEFRLGLHHNSRTLNNQVRDGYVMDMDNHNSAICVTELGGLGSGASLKHGWKASHDQTTWVTLEADVEIADDEDNKVVVTCLESVPYRYVRPYYEEEDGVACTIRSSMVILSDYHTTHQVSQSDDVVGVHLFVNPAVQ